MRLHSKTCVVTGGGSGLGKAMVRGFAREGAAVGCVDVDDDRLKQTEAEFADSPGTVLGIDGDVRRWTDVKSMVETVRDEFGPIDILVNNAGVTQRTVTGGAPRETVPNLAVEVWDAVIETNARGPFLCSKAVLPDMLATGSGRLIHISSSMGRDATTRGGYAPYVASKHALEGFCACLADELGETNVSSVVLRPPDGAVYTETRTYLPQSAQETRHSPDVITEAAIQLADGRGTNGGRYVATSDGAGFEREA